MDKSQKNKLQVTQGPDSKALISTGKDDDGVAPRVKANVVMRLPGGKGMAKVQVDNCVPAHSNETFMESFGELLLSTRKGGNWNTPFEFGMMQEAMARMKPPPSPVEVYNAFWKAYGDKYTPATGIEWKNICKHIEEAREKFYTLPEEPESKEEYLKRKVKRLKGNE